LALKTMKVALSVSDQTFVKRRGLGSKRSKSGPNCQCLDLLSKQGVVLALNE
jgi:hypothetical protein